MKFKEIFKDSNDYNEKSIIGFLSFLIMIITLIMDIATGLFGKELVLNQFVYDSFVYVTIGALGIASLEKFAPRKHQNTDNTAEQPAP